MKLPSSETRNAVLGNVFISDGKPGKVLRIKASKRIGERRRPREEETEERGGSRGLNVFTLKAIITS